MATPARPRAIIYISRSDDLDHLTTACVEYCERRGYTLVSLVAGDPRGRKWRDAYEMLLSGNADVLVAPSRGHLPANRVPRIEIVDEQGRQVRPQKVPRERRPRRTQR